MVRQPVNDRRLVDEAIVRGLYKICGAEPDEAAIQAILDDVARRDAAKREARRTKPAATDDALARELHYCGDSVNALGDAVLALVGVMNQMLTQQEKWNRHHGP